MPLGYMDFRDMVASFPGLRALRRAEQAKAVYLRDKRTLPDQMKRLFDNVNVVRLAMEEPDDVSSAMGVATGEVASVSLGLRGDTLHYVRRSLEMMRDREVTMDWTPRADPFEGEVLPQLDGFLVDLSNFNEVEVDRENGVVRAGVGSRWSEVRDACRSAGWFLPLFPALPLDAYIGDIVRGETLLSSFRGGPETCLRNVDFISADAGYGESGFDDVPNNSTGYDLNSLFLNAGSSLAIPLSVTFSLLPSAEDLRARTYSLKGNDELTAALAKVSGTGILPVNVSFGDEGASKVVSGREGITSTALLHGTEDTLPSQGKALDRVFEGAEVEESLYQPRSPAAAAKGLSPLAELRLSVTDLAPLLTDLSTWRDSQASSVGLSGSLQEGGSVSIVPFVAEKAGRGERFDRLVELVEVAERHECVLRGNHLVHLLTSESTLEKRFSLVRRIKEKVDLPLVVNPSALLWVPSVG